MASTLIEVWRIAIYETDGESIGERVGFKSNDGDITDYEPDMMYFNSEEEAEEEIDNSDEHETGMREVAESVMFDMIDFMTMR